MDKRFSRTALLLGEDATERLAKARVAIFGIGGVGGYTAEALARGGIGCLDLIDDDTVCLSNINRQIYALESTVGRYKTEVAKERILDINPNIKVNTYNTFYLPETSGEFDFKNYDYVVDAIDTITGKIELAVNAQNAGVPIISSMGAGNKLDPTAFEVDDVYKTSVCPLAKVMRRELKKRGIEKLKVVYSKEKAIAPKNIINIDNDINNDSEEKESRKQTPGSISFVPSVVGLIAAGEVIKDLCGVNN